MKVLKENSVEFSQREKRLLELEYNLISDFIKLRRELGLTQKEMALECGVVREMIAVLETKKQHFQLNTFIKILEPFGYTLGIKKIDEEK